VGSLSMNEIVAAQKIPFILLQPLGFIIFFIGSLAELNRSPFDLLEADSEIVAGYHIEYSGMKFAMFYLGEYGHAAAYSAIIATVFLGGWQGPLLPPILWFVIKMLIVFFIMIWLRATLPRFRVDQLMSFGWKGLLPMAIINLFIVAIEVLWIPVTLPWLIIIINFIAAGILILLMSKLITLGSGRVEV
jgi:NADH-quinone oxidoreductase subunit H